MLKATIQAVFLGFCVFIAPVSQAAVVNINKANAAALTENLSGIGPKKAAAIISYRKSNGAYKSVDDLLNVKGIGEKLLQKNRNDLSINSGATAVEEKAQKTTKKLDSSSAESADKPTADSKKKASVTEG